MGIEASVFAVVPEPANAVLSPTSTSPCQLRLGVILHLLILEQQQTPKHLFPLPPQTSPPLPLSPAFLTPLSFELSSTCYRQPWTLNTMKAAEQEVWAADQGMQAYLAAVAIHNQAQLCASSRLQRRDSRPAPRAADADV